MCTGVRQSAQHPRRAHPGLSFLHSGHTDLEPSVSWIQVTPDDPRLWCALGDLTLKDEHYETAWQRSSQRSTRAQRSLARSAQRETGYEKVPLSDCPFRGRQSEKMPSCAARLDVSQSCHVYREKCHSSKALSWSPACCA